jgi:aminopeptidase N
MPDGTPATYWLLPQDSAMRARLENESKTAFTWLEQRLGPYPFSTFGVVIVGGESGMETQTMITLSRGSLDRPDAVIAHEIAHQWFGDAVTPTDWKDLWLNEGWAMYMQQWFESSTGQYEYDGGISKWRPIDNQSRSVSGPPGEYNPKRFADLNVYLGPAMMLDAIRKRVGDAEFDTIARQWVSEHEYGNVSRAEFVSWLSRKTGQDFTGLVHLWLDSPHTPQ